MAKVRSERDLVDNGIRALVDALGYSGAARFLRHFSKGNGDYLQIQKQTLQRDASGIDIQKGRRALFQQAELIVLANSTRLQRYSNSFRRFENSRNVEVSHPSLSLNFSL